jgi:hypothetical protein
LVIKKEHTLRERLPLPRFFELCLQVVEKWSREYMNSDKVFSKIASISLKDWTSGYQWAKNNKQIVSEEFDNNTIFYSPAGESSKITQDEIQCVEKCRWNTFEQYKKRAFSVWIIDMPKLSNNWQDGVCTCPYFMKHFLCKHLIGLAIRLKYAKPPPAAKDIPIGEKRKRGRPKKATRALLMD